MYPIHIHISGDSQPSAYLQKSHLSESRTDQCTVKMENKSTVMCSEESFILSTINALWKNRCLSLIVGLKVPELLCAAEEPLSIEDIAKKSGCASSEGLYFVMKMLALWGIGKELENKQFAKNRGMQLLRRDNGPGLGHLIEYFCSEENIAATRSLAACIKRNQVPFVFEHGMNHFEYMNDIENRPYDNAKMLEGSSEYPIGSDERRREFAANYLDAMTCTSRLRTLPDVQGVNNVFEVFPWSTCKRLLDMGGCSGHFLSRIMKLPGCEHIDGHVVDLPDVVDTAQKNVESLGIPKHRIGFIKHNFMEPFPCDLQLQVDTVVFKNILSMFIHDHEVMTKILVNCRSCFPSHGGRLLIIDFLTRDADDTGNPIGINGLEPEAMSLHWFNISGHRLLTRSEWITNLQEIGTKAGYQVKQVYDTFSGGSKIFELSCIN